MNSTNRSVVSLLKSPWSLLPPIFAKSDSLHELTLLENTKGELEAQFRRIEASESEKKRWVDLWCDLDSRRSNRVSYKDFAAYFNLGSSIWVEKLFSIINKSLTGVINFNEFINFSISYLCIDQDLSMEFAYRLLSLSSGNFDLNKSILNNYDIKQFITYRYALKPSLIQKRSIELMQYMDKDSSGGLSLSEFQLFCRNNLTFLRFCHILITHLRKCIFGYEFWLEKSRALTMRKVHPQYLIVSPAINSDNEIFDKVIETSYDDLQHYEASIPISEPSMQLQSSNALNLSSKVPCTCFSLFGVSLLLF